MEEPVSQQQSAKSDPWYLIWFRVYVSPSVGTYQSILQAGDIRLSRAAAWVVSGTAFGVLFPVLLYLLSAGTVLHGDLRTALIMGDIGWVTYVLSGLFALVIAAVVFMLVTHAIHWLARQFGGSGDVDRLGMLLGAIHAPAAILDSLLEGVFPGWPGLVIRILITAFQVVLLSIAIKAAEDLNWGRAIGVSAILVFVAGMILAAVVGCFSLTF